MRKLLIFCTVLILTGSDFILFPAPASANGIYPDKVLRREAPRLKRAITRIYKEGIKPTLSSKERAGLAQVRFRFPMPKPDDHVLDFYAGKIGRADTVVFPMQSLMMVEDLATAYAWLYVSQRDFGPIDLYFAMLQRKPLDVIGAAGRRGILNVLGVPENVLKDKRVDTLSLSLRNEAFAFIMVHELGHLLFKHKGLSDISPAQARADEVQSDAFALDVLARSGTPPLGAVLFFQAQIFSLPHKGEYKTRKAWESYLETASTHPLSVDRIRAMAKMVSGPLAAQRQNETAIWRDIGQKLYELGGILADVEQHDCMKKVAEKAPVSLLREPGRAEAGAIKRYCVSL